MSLEKLTKNYLDVLTNLGEQPERDGLKGTPERAYSGLVEQRDRWRHPEQFVE